MSHTLNGQTITRAAIQIGARGVWWADVEVAEPDMLTGAATLVVGGQTFVGTIVAGGAVYGRGRYRVAAGAGGWGRTLPAKGYANDAGVKTQTILADAASACGETLGFTLTTRQGAHFARVDGPASLVFRECGISDWYVDVDGVTHSGTRAASTYSGDGVVTTLDSGSVVVRCDDVIGLLPGVSVGGITAHDVEISVDASKLAVTCHAATGASTGAINDAIARLIARSLPDTRAFGTWEYRVVSQNVERLNLQSVTTRHGLPDLTNVFVRQLDGVRQKWALGSLCLVAFANNDLARPVVIGGDAPDSPGWLPTELRVEASNLHVKLVGSLAEIGDTAAAKDFLAMAAKVNDNFAFWSDLFTNWTPVANDGGSALKGAFTAAFGATPPVDVATAHLKGN